MTDLVERLRKGVEYERHGDMEPDIYSANETMKSAADEIERLTARVAELEEERDKAKAENFFLCGSTIIFIKKEARAKALKEAAEIAHKAVVDEEVALFNAGDNFAFQQEASGGLDVAEQIRDTILSILKKEKDNA